MELEFEQVVSLYYAPLHRFARSLARDDGEAGDLVQQTFYIWAERGHQLRDASKLKSWLLTTLHREFLGGLRHATRFPHFEVGDVADELPHVTPATVDEMDGRAVLEALRRVEEIYRAPLALFYLEDMSYKEIAETLDVPTGTVMSRLSRGKTQLRELLSIEGAEHRSKIDSPKPAIVEGNNHHG